MADWLGKVRGHVGDARAREAEYVRTRAEAEAKPRSIILTEREVREGQWDAGKVIYTTMGGQARPVTADDLKTFQHNMRLAQRRFKSGQGITARQVIDMASAKPLPYIDPQPGQASSDLDKARKEITSGVPVSAVNGQIRFLTNASRGSNSTRHNVLVVLHAFEEAAARVAAMQAGESPKQVASWLRKQKLSFDCDCERHRYFFRYLASIGGFAAGHKETGFPKIRNPKLIGVACKHVLRVVTELESSGSVLRFLENHLAKVSEYKAQTTLRQKEAEEAAETRKGPTAIKTSDQRKSEAQSARERRAARAAVRAAPKPARRSQATRRATKTEAAWETVARDSGLSVATLRKLLAKAGKR